MHSGVDPDGSGGWYPDPWGQADWRWWDGQQWTHHISAPLPPPPPSGGRLGDSFFAPKIAGRQLNPILALAIVIVCLGLVFGAATAGSDTRDYYDNLYGE